MVAVGDVVDPVLQVLDGPADLARAHARDHRGLGREELRAEAPTRRQRPDVQLVGRDLQRARHHEQVAGERQRVRVDHELAGGLVEVRDGADGLQRLAAGAVPAQPVGDDQVGRGEVALDVAEVEAALVGQVRPERLVHQRGTVGEGVHRVDEHRQRRVLHVDERQRVLGEVAAVGDDDRDALPDVADLVQRQAAPRVLGRVGPEVGHRVAQLRGPGAGDHGVHPGRGLGRRRVDRRDRGVGVRAAQHGGVQHARDGEVADVAAATAQQLRVLDAPDGLADPLPVGLVRADGWRLTGGAAVDGGHDAASPRIRPAAAQTASTMNW